VLRDLGKRPLIRSGRPLLRSRGVSKRAGGGRELRQTPENSTWLEKTDHDTKGPGPFRGSHPEKNRGQNWKDYLREGAVSSTWFLEPALREGTPRVGSSHAKVNVRKEKFHLCKGWLGQGRGMCGSCRPTQRFRFSLLGC